MTNIIDFASAQKIRALKTKIEQMEEKVHQLKIIWEELTPEEKLNPVLQKQVQASLLKARLTKFRAQNAIDQIKASI